MALQIDTTLRQHTLPLLDRVRHDSPFWWRATFMGLLLFTIVYCLRFADARLFNDVSVWDKPSKFLLSFAVHSLTFGWAFSLMPATERGRSINTWLSYAFVAIFGLEIAYILFRSAMGEASHFNATSDTAKLLYGFMGIGSIGLVAITGYFGWRLLVTRRDLAARAAGIGLVIGATLGTLAGGFLSGQESHWVGGVASDANGLPFFNWSTTGGDLRVPHFFGLHAMQFIPLAVWLWPRSLTLFLSSAAVTLLTAGVFIQAVMGYPFISL